MMANTVHTAHTAVKTALYHLRRHTFPSILPSFRFIPASIAMRQAQTVSQQASHRQPACSRVFLVLSFYSHSIPILNSLSSCFLLPSFHLLRQLVSLSIGFPPSYVIPALRTVLRKSTPLLTYLVLFLLLFPVFSRILAIYSCDRHRPPFLPRLHKISLIPPTRPSYDILS